MSWISIIIRINQLLPIEPLKMHKELLRLESFSSNCLKNNLPLNSLRANTRYIRNLQNKIRIGRDLNPQK